MTDTTETQTPPQTREANRSNTKVCSPPETQSVSKEDLRAEMAEICAHLKHELENPNPCATALERQVVVLDRLLYAVMRRSLKNDIENGDFNPDHLSKALRIQKQSMDGYKAIYTIECIQEIMKKQYAPSPGIPYEQNEEPWILEE